jgi:hypothetical protein
MFKRAAVDRHTVCPTTKPNTAPTVTARTVTTAACQATLPFTVARRAPNARIVV